MRMLLCAALALSAGCRGTAHAEPPHDARAGSGVTVIIEIPPTPIDARVYDYAAPLYIDPNAQPGSAGNGKVVPLAPVPDAAPQ